MPDAGSAKARQSARAGAARFLRWFAGLAAVAGVVILAGVFARALLTAPEGGLEPWHTHIPPELTAAEIDRADWAGYLAAEARAFASVDANVTRRLRPETQQGFNRYFAGSPAHPPRFRQDWNRSFVLEPASTPKGIVVLIHGLTDAPYSLRHIAQLYRARGWVAIGVRMPAHGTVPAALTAADWRDWLAATRLGMREARRRAGPGRPIDLIGYSNGGALAVKYTLDSLVDKALPAPRRVVLLSPMIGITEFARFSGVAGWPALFPAFSHTAWFSLLPEFNPFKYNSFPVNGGRQTWRLTAAIHDQLSESVASGAIARMPPILTFQSLADSTVSTPAIIDRLYAVLPANGSELVIFDINRSATFASALSRPAATTPDQLAPKVPRRWRLTVITNAAPATSDVVERTTGAGEATPRVRPTGLAFPSQIFSLSHVALPFPTQDGLYGGAPDPADDFGIRIGTLAARGESGVLVTDFDAVLRLTFSPFYPWMADRIAAGLTPQ